MDILKAVYVYHYIESAIFCILLSPRAYVRMCAPMYAGCFVCENIVTPFICFLPIAVSNVFCCVTMPRCASLLFCVLILFPYCLCLLVYDYVAVTYK